MLTSKVQWSTSATIRQLCFLRGAAVLVAFSIIFHLLVDLDLDLMTTSLNFVSRTTTSTTTVYPTHIHAPFPDDLRFRRVCASLKLTTLCMTIRYPFPVAVQDSNATFPKPFEERLLTLNGMKYIDGQDLEHCQNQTKWHKNGGDSAKSMENVVKNCLESQVLRDVQRYPDQQDALMNRSVFAVWTRQVPGKSPKLFGTTLPTQREHADNFFKGQVVFVLGASTTPSVTIGMSGIFGNCERRPHIRNSVVLCAGHGGKELDEMTRSDNIWKYQTNYSILDETMTYMTTQWYHPGAILNGDFLGYLQNNPGFQRDPVVLQQNQVRKFSVIIENPFPHMHRESIILEDKVNTSQKAYFDAFRTLRSVNGSQTLSDMGWELDKFIVFDGHPQAFPTASGSFKTEYLNNFKGSGEAEFRENGGFPGWREELGGTCRGPLPRNSPLSVSQTTVVRDIAADYFGNEWIGRTWEFANVFWFQLKGWTKFQGKVLKLDCTHSHNQWSLGEDGMSTVHKYVLQAMMDDHYDSLDSAAS